MSELFETIRQIDEVTEETVRDWNCSVREIAEELNLYPSHISNVISGKRKSAGGFLFVKVGDEQKEDRTDKTVPVRKISLSINDIDEDSPEDVVRTKSNIALLSERENEYIDWVWDCLQNISLIQKLRCQETGELYSVYYNRSECEGEIASHLKGGYHYDVEPAKTIKRACELVLFDLFLEDELKDFQSDFNVGDNHDK